MASPIDKIADQVHRGFIKIFHTAVLGRGGEATGGEDWDPTIGAGSNFICKALISSWGQQEIAGGLVTGNERKILILAKSLLTEPRNGDTVTMQEGPFVGELFTISDAPSGNQPAVKTDPTKALWIVRAS